jgi:hypothetical protein
MRDPRCSDIPVGGAAKEASLHERFEKDCCEIRKQMNLNVSRNRKPDLKVASTGADTVPK